MGDDPIRALIAEVQRLHDVDAQHKRGWTLGTRRALDALLHTIEELTEVGRAQTRAERASELGDALACFLHYLVLADFDADDIARCALIKLAKDFTEPPCSTEEDLSRPWRVFDKQNVTCNAHHHERDARMDRDVRDEQYPDKAPHGYENFDADRGPRD